MKLTDILGHFIPLYLLVVQRPDQAAPRLDNSLTLKVSLFFLSVGCFGAKSPAAIRRQQDITFVAFDVSAVPLYPTAGLNMVRTLSSRVLFVTFLFPAHVGEKQLWVPVAFRGIMRHFVQRGGLIHVLSNPNAYCTVPVAADCCVVEPKHHYTVCFGEALVIKYDSDRQSNETL